MIDLFVGLLGVEACFGVKMAATVTDGMSEYIRDMTLCSICMETFEDPRVLPCNHTFCLKCIDTYCSDKSPGEKTACPICRQLFAVPPDGAKNLTSNFFMHQLLEVNKSPKDVPVASEKQVTENICKLCFDVESEIPSTSYCNVCDQHMCDSCSASHRKSKESTSHQIVRVQNSQRFNTSFCHKHRDEKVTLYCCDCNVVMCVRCVGNHKQHKISALCDTAQELCSQLKIDLDKISTGVKKKQDSVRQSEKDTEAFLEKVGIMEKKISKQYDELLITLLQSHRSQLMEELNSFKERILKDVAKQKDEFLEQAAITESFSINCRDVIDKGTAYDVSRTGPDLHARALKILKAQEESGCCNLSEVDMKFIPSVLSTDSAVKNYIGTLAFTDTNTVRAMFLAKPALLHVIIEERVGTSIAGVTVLGGRVYVVGANDRVHIFNGENFAYTSTIPIPESKNLQEIVSCSLKNCLYLGDHTQKAIYRYDLSTTCLQKWPVTLKSTAFKLSVTKCHNVLTTMKIGNLNVAQKYTPDGSLIRVMTLHASIDCPLHSVQLSTGNYVVSHKGASHQLCIVDATGNVVKSFAGCCERGGDQVLSVPSYLAVDKRDNILVADSGNNSVRLFSPTLGYVCKIKVPGYKMHEPCVIYFDEAQHRLYIGEAKSPRLLVLDCCQATRREDGSSYECKVL